MQNTCTSIRSVGTPAEIHTAFEVPNGMRAYGIRADEPLFIIWRAFLEKATKTGPSYSEIVYDRAIKFSPKKTASSPEEIGLKGAGIFKIIQASHWLNSVLINY